MAYTTSRLRGVRSCPYGFILNRGVEKWAHPVGYAPIVRPRACPQFARRLPEDLGVLAHHNEDEDSALCDVAAF